ncbi:hypothetical protein AB0L71_29675 [Streptomyces sp. NPDC052052]|uniref:hypothetical protein n=1 Tax=Streptomyces sp. NPDC052052 TaxID=3154756 RepID=UPI0034212B98
MKTWHEGARSGHTHEPNEVTVQRDGLGRQLSELAVQPSTSEGADGPVFVDESGRRGKKLRRLGWGLAAVCACYGVTLTVALIGGSSSAPWLPLSGPEKHKDADVVQVSPAPTGSTGAQPLPDRAVAGRTTTTGPTTPGGTATPAGRTTVSAPAGPSRSAVSSAPAVPPPTPSTGGGRTPSAAPTTPAPSADTTATPSAGASTPPVDGTTPPAASPQPPVHEQEGAQR